MTPPPISGVLETVLYCDGPERKPAERFYAEVLGLAEVARWEDGTSYRVGSGVLLIFDREKLSERAGPIAAHGTTGPGHACFAVEPDEYGAWADRLRAGGVEITHEEEWPSGKRSFYFEDPAGNLLEIAEGDLWPRPSSS